jgi:mannose-6-phosphate isomerase-like protein (cupin superfamily)
MTFAAAFLARKKDVGIHARPRTGLMMLMQIQRWDVRRDGPLNEAALRQKLDALGYEATPRLYPVDAVAAARGEGSERVEAVISGLIKVTIDGESAILTAGDVVFVPGGAVRRVEVVGTSPASGLHAVYRTHPV